MADDRYKTRRNWNEPGHAHELTFSCYQRFRFLLADRTRSWFIEALERARAQHEFRLWAYVVMPEHAHVLMLPKPHTPIESIRKTIKQSVARRAIQYLRTTESAWLQRLRIDHPGGRTRYHFWLPGGGYDRNLWSEDAVWTAIQYIHMNPVRRALCCHPEDWKWSSARWYAQRTDVQIQMDEPPPPVLPSQMTRGNRSGQWG